MSTNKSRMTAVVLLGLSSIAGFGMGSEVWAQDAKPQAPAPDKEVDVTELSLPDAIHDGLLHSELIRIVNIKVEGADAIAAALKAGTCYPGDPIQTFTIAPRDRNINPYVFKSEVMALIRSVEQQYWALQLTHVEYWAAETAVDLTEEICKREEAKIQYHNLPNIAEAHEQLDRFKKTFGEKKAELATAELQLRKTLGLPATDGRRIVPTTRPLETELKLDWEKSRQAMLENQPDILQSKALLSAMDRTKTSPAQIELQEAFHQHVLKQTEYSLAQYFALIESNFKLFPGLDHLKVAGKQRLDAQQAFYDNGTITIDRYLDAVNRWSESVSQAAKCRTQYNNAIAAFEEVKGTLLACDRIIIADPAKSAKGDGLDTALRRASLDVQAKTDANHKSDSVGKTYSFQFSLGSGPKPLEIRGSFKAASTQPTETTKRD